MAEIQTQNTEKPVNLEQKETSKNSEDYTKQMDKSKEVDKNHKLQEILSVLEDNQEEPKLSDEELKEKIV
jgi:outer membrane PBP1 activator LpoA protein